MVKDDNEIAIIHKALHIAEAAFIRTMPQIFEGMTERELAHIIEHEMWGGRRNQGIFRVPDSFWTPFCNVSRQTLGLRTEKG